MCAFVLVCVCVLVRKCLISEKGFEGRLCPSIPMLLFLLEATELFMIIGTVKVKQSSCCIRLCICYAELVLRFSSVNDCYSEKKPYFDVGLHIMDTVRMKELHNWSGCFSLFPFPLVWKHTDIGIMTTTLLSTWDTTHVAKRWIDATYIWDCVLHIFTQPQKTKKQCRFHISVL